MTPRKEQHHLQIGHAYVNVEIDICDVFFLDIYITLYRIDIHCDREYVNNIIIALSQRQPPANKCARKEMIALLLTAFILIRPGPVGKNRQICHQTRKL